MSTINFYAGPAILAKEVLEEAKQGIENFAGMGLSILEISHRSKQFVEVLDEARARVRSLLNLPTEYDVLFLTGGASSQFYMTAMNLLNENDKAGYINTGAWSTKAIKEAKLFGTIDEVASSKDKNFSYVPKGYEIDPSYRYLHFTSNNTIYGTQFKSLPTTDVRLIADMSSDIFSRPIDVRRYDIIYAGAQKNLGPSGTTLVIVKKDILNKVNRQIPSMLNYQTHIDKGSSFNTPPVYAIYVSLLSLRWLENNGGIQGLQKRNEEKAALLYNEIDRNPLFEGTAAVEDRSLMNVCFLPKNEAHTSVFIEKAAQAGCVGIGGHRSVGGFRASIYNAMPKAGVQALVDVMQEFEKENA
ncbi:MAG: 3-phosphoserine/phosphohydroxythreonine transaminase [Saprospiraceae bacterium]|nr:3-phosphoserine/phosphohydroxythreonine transaminase [Saprospiraceae bacterium]